MPESNNKSEKTLSACPLRLIGYRDKESLKALVRAAIDSFPDVKRTLYNMIAEGDMVAILNRWDGTFTCEDVGGIPANGNPWTADLYRISDGQILEHWQVADYSNFTKAVGISN